MCHPDSEVNIRLKASKHSEIVAHAYAGDRITLTGKKSGKWYHCLYPCENGEGWIRGDYLVFSEPTVFPKGKFYETNRGNLYARYSIKGNKCHKLKEGVQLKVYVLGDEWSVTSLGFIMTEFLSEVPEG